MRYAHGYKMALIKITILSSLFMLSAWGQQIDLSSGAKVEFDAVGKPSLINIKGTGAKTTGSLVSKEGNLLGEFVINLKDFTTDLETRDEHMKEKYLEIGKPGFDKAILKIDQKSDAVISANGSWNPLKLIGHLTLHGVTKEVPLNCKLDIKDSKAKGNVNFKIKLKDYGIEIPSFAGVTLADEVTANVIINHKVIP